MSACVFCRWIKWPLGVMAFVGSAPVFAQSVAGTLDTLQFHGFMSQALVISDHNDFFGPSSSKGGSLQFYELGLNASLRPSDNLLISAQVLSRRAGGEASDAKPKVDYAVIDYQVFSSSLSTMGFSLGRIKAPFGFYNKTRDVPFTRPSILLPQSIYFDRTRTQALTGDGVGFYYEKRFDKSSLKFEAEAGRPQIDSDVEESVLGSLPGSLEADWSNIYQVLYDYDGGRFIGSITYANVRSKYYSGLNYLGDAEFYFDPLILSLQVNRSKWSLTTEIAYRKQGVRGFDDSENNKKAKGLSWYLQYVYRLNDEWSLLGRYDSLVVDVNDSDGRKYEDNGFGDSYSRYAYDWTAGLQWNIKKNILLSAEYHNIEGTGWIPYSGSKDLDKYWDLYLLQASYRF